MINAAGTRKTLFIDYIQFSTKRCHVQLEIILGLRDNRNVQIKSYIYKVNRFFVVLKMYMHATGMNETFNNNSKTKIIFLSKNWSSQ